MIKLSEATAIALHVMIYIANRKESVHSLKEIARFFDISENHLSKVLQRLVKTGFLISIKGPKGGFKLAEGKKTSTLMDIYEAIEGKYVAKNCLFASRHFRSCCCIMKPLLSSINNTFEDFMNDNRICDLKV